MFRRWLKIVGAIALLFSLRPGAAFAAPQVSLEQAQETTPQQGVDTSRVPVAIAAAEIPVRALAALDTLRRIRAQLATIDTDDVDSLLTTIVQSLDQLQQASTTEQFEPVSTLALDGLAREWRERQTQLDRSQQSLQSLSRSLNARRQGIRRLRDVWTVTRNSASAQALPSEVVAQIQAVLTGAQDVEAELRSHRDALLAVLIRIAEQEITVVDALAEIDNAREQVRRRYFVADNPPLWRAWRRQSEGVDFDDVRATWRGAGSTLRSYAERNRGRIVTQVALFVALTMLMVGLRRRSRGWGVQNDEALQAAQKVLARPVSAALLITLLATPVVHTSAPIALRSLAALVSIIPLLRLLPGVVAPAMRPALFATIAFLTAQWLVSLSLTHPLTLRLVLLGIAFFGATGLVLLLRPSSPARTASDSSWWRATLFLCRVAVVVLTVSLTANVLGYGSLAVLLTRATLRSAHSGLAIFMGVKVLDGLVTALLRPDLLHPLKTVRRHAEFLAGQARRVIHVAAALAFLGFTLSYFNVWQPVVDGVGAAMSREFSIGSWGLSFSDVVIFGLVIWLSFTVARVVRAVLQEDVLSRLELERGVPRAVSAVVYYAVLVIGFLFAAGAAGFDLTRFTLLVGAFGVGLGFGLQSVINNLISGLILMFERPIQVGDTIEVEPFIGVVKRIGIRASSVRTFDGAEVIVPNGDLISGKVINWTLSDRLRRIDVSVGVAYGTDPSNVLEILLNAASPHPSVLSSPKPEALFVGFGDSSLDFLLRFWTTDIDSWRKVRSDVTVLVNDALKDGGIEIPFPQRDLHVRSVDSNAQKAIPAPGASGSVGRGRRASEQKDDVSNE